jgi:hypothetical protein
MAIKLKIEVEVTEERIKDLLTGALEGGSNYWYELHSKVNPNNVKMNDIYDYPFTEGCGLMIGDSEGDEEPKLLNMAAMENGLRIMAEKYAWHLNDFIAENDDATTSDVFLQCSLYGDVIYG